MIYPKEKIIDLFKSNTNEELVKKYSKNTLTDLYISLYGRKPLSAKSSKMEMVKTIRDYIYSMQRAEAFNRMNNRT